MYLAAKTTLISRSLFSLLVILAASSTVKADVYMDLDRVPGAATDSKHANWIQCEAAQFSVNRPASSLESKASAGTSKASFSEISLVRKSDVSSAEFFIRAANGQIAPEATIEFTDNAGFVYLRVELKGVAVTSYSVSASDGEIAEEIKVTYSEISMTFFVQDSSGKEAGRFTRAWSVEQNIEL